MLSNSCTSVPAKNIIFNAVSGLIQLNEEEINTPNWLRVVCTQEPLLDFDETLAFLKEYIDGRVDDPSSSSSVKKTFQVNIVQKPLTAEDLDSFIAISAKIPR